MLQSTTPRCLPKCLISTIKTMIFGPIAPITMSILKCHLSFWDYVSQIHERGYRNHPLNEEQKASNREKSKTRARVEHVFGGWVMTMGGKLVRCIGIEQVRAYQGLKDLTYNLTRYVLLAEEGGVCLNEEKKVKMSQ